MHYLVDQLFYIVEQPFDGNQLCIVFQTIIQ